MNRRGSEARTLDFVVVGAAKAGTTALFEYLRTHPEIAIPPEKETGFFVIQNLYDRGWNWYSESFLRDLPADRRYGDISPGYMWGTPFSGEPLHAPVTDPPSPHPPGDLERVVPGRIHAALPGVKVVCMLRDPIDRAISHYQMSRLWGWEQRRVNEAMEELLLPENQAEARSWITGTTWYLTLGEYGRILEPYFELFSRDDVLVIFSKDLLERREQTLAALFAFIEVDPSWRPPNLDVRYREAATARKIRNLDLYRWRQALTEVDALRKVWRALPDSQRARINRLSSWATFRLDLWNAKRGESPIQLEPHVRNAMKAHFEPDARTLATLIGQEPPWLETWRREEEAGRKAP